jgi:hypothetical protein
MVGWLGFGIFLSSAWRFLLPSHFLCVWSLVSDCSPLVGAVCKYVIFYFLFLFFFVFLREFISDKHGSEVQNYYILKFFFLTIKGIDTSTPTIKSFRPILLTAVTFLKTHRFLPIKILFF